MPDKKERNYAAWLQYVTARYPGDYPEFTLDECKKAYEAALRIKKFVVDKIWDKNIQKDHGSAAK